MVALKYFVWLNSSLCSAPSFLMICSVSSVQAENDVFCSFLYRSTKFLYPELCLCNY